MDGVCIMAYGVNAPFGLQPRIHKNGSIWNGQLTSYPIKSGYNTNIFSGDPVYFDQANGTIVLATAGIGNPIAGVFMGVKYSTLAGAGTGQGTASFSPYWPANTPTLNGANAEALVCDDPTVLYDIQSDSSLNFSNLFPGNTQGGVLASQLFQNANIIFNRAGANLGGDPRSGLSNATLGLLTAQATAQFKIVDFTQIPGSFTIICLILHITTLWYQLIMMRITVALAP